MNKINIPYNIYIFLSLLCFVRCVLRQKKRVECKVEKILEKKFSTNILHSTPSTNSVLCPLRAPNLNLFSLRLFPFQQKK